MIAPLKWRTFKEILGGPDDFETKIIDHVVDGGSMCCLGPAGAGKRLTL